MFIYGEGFLRNSRFVCDPIKQMPDILLNLSESWLVNELSSYQICLIGALANVDAAFCDQLKEKLAIYHSPTSLSRKNSAGVLFETSFGPASIESHFRALQRTFPPEMYQFLYLLCKRGSAAMLKLFLDIGFDVKRSSGTRC